MMTWFKVPNWLNQPRIVGSLNLSILLMGRFVGKGREPGGIPSTTRVVLDLSVWFGPLWISKRWEMGGVWIGMGGPRIDEGMGSGVVLPGRRGS